MFFCYIVGICLLYFCYLLGALYSLSGLQSYIAAYPAQGLRFTFLFAGLDCVIAPIAIQPKGGTPGE